MILLHLQIVLSFLILISTKFSFALSKTYQCEDGSEIFCTINLNLTRDDLAFDVNVKNKTDVEYFYLHGIIPILSRENIEKICEDFPNLLKIDASGCQINEIGENTFEKCTKLQTLFFFGSNIQFLHKNSFRGLTKLRELVISNGNVPNFDLDFSDLKNLKVLDLKSLNISSFSPEILREQTNLKRLDLSENNLFDLDVEKMLEYTPNLEFFYLHENKFKCSRLEKVLELLKGKNVNMKLLFKFSVKTPDHVDLIECLNDEHWLSEVTKEKTKGTTTV